MKLTEFNKIVTKKHLLREQTNCIKYRYIVQWPWKFGFIIFENYIK